MAQCGGTVLGSMSVLPNNSLAAVGSDGGWGWGLVFSASAFLVMKNWLQAKRFFFSLGGSKVT